MRVLILFDVSNLYYGAMRVFSGKLSYEKLLEVGLNGRDLFKAIAYGSSDSVQGNFLHVLQKNGINPHFRASKVWLGATERKSDLDVQMAVDAIKFKERYDTLAIFTADGDLAPALEHLRNDGVNVEVFGITISGDLKNNCDYWQELDSSLILPETRDVGSKSESSDSKVDSTNQTSTSDGGGRSVEAPTGGAEG